MKQLLFVLVFPKPTVLDKKIYDIWLLVNKESKVLSIC